MLWRKLFLLLIPIGIVMAIVAKPIKVDCITTQHTYCPAQVEEVVKQLSDKKFLLARRHFNQIKTQAMSVEPALSKVEFKQTPWWGIQAVIEMSPVVLTISTENQSFELRANGLLMTTQIEPPIPLIIDEPSRWLSEDLGQVNNLDSADIERLAKLYNQYSEFSPRVTKIVFHSTDEIKLFIEGHGPILVRADDFQWLDHQLAALQAFFRTSTIASDYQELDARFSNLVVR